MRRIGRSQHRRPCDGRSERGASRRGARGTIEYGFYTRAKSEPPTARRKPVEGALVTPYHSPQRTESDDGWDYLHPSLGTNANAQQQGQNTQKAGHAGQKRDNLPDIQLEIEQIEASTYDYHQAMRAGNAQARADEKQFNQTKLLHSMTIEQLSGLPTSELRIYQKKVMENRKKSIQRTGGGGGKKAQVWAMRANEIDKILSSRKP